MMNCEMLAPDDKKEAAVKRREAEEMAFLLIFVRTSS